MIRWLVNARVLFYGSDTAQRAAHYVDGPQYVESLARARILRREIARQFMADAYVPEPDNFEYQQDWLYRRPSNAEECRSALVITIGPLGKIASLS